MRERKWTEEGHTLCLHPPLPSGTLSAKCVLGGCTQLCHSVMMMMMTMMMGMMMTTRIVITSDEKDDENEHEVQQRKT
jgi:hypothetical protein